MLAFLDDLTTLFDNNQAECDPRRIKAQQEVSGSLRTQGHALGASRQALFIGQPLYPAFA